MKILITSPLTHPENHPLAIFLQDIYDYLKKDNQVTVITYGKKNGIENDRNFIVINKKENILVRNTKFLYNVLGNITGTDFIFCTHALVAAVPSIIVSKIFRIPLVVNFGSDEIYERYLYKYKNNISLEKFYNKQNSDKYFKILNAVQRFILQNANTVIVPNNYFKKLITHTYRLDAEKIKVIYPYAGKEIILPFPAQKEENSIVVYASLFSGAKSKIQNIVDAVTELKPEFPNIKLNIFGDGEIKKDLVSQVKNAGAEEYINFHGKVSAAELYHYKKLSQIFISHTPSVRNIYHIIENFQADCITLADKNELSSEIITDNKNGKLINIEDKENIKKSLREIFSNQSLRNEINNEMRNELENKYSLIHFTNEVLKLIK